MTIKQEFEYIIYLDANNLYGYAISKFLPTSGFKRIDHKEFDLNKYKAIAKKVSFSKLILNIQKNFVNYSGYP